MSLGRFLRGLFPTKKRATRFTIAGRGLLWSKPLRAELTSGTQPWQETFDVPSEDLAWWTRVADAGKPVALVIDSGPDSIPANRKVTMKGLYVLKPRPGDAPPFRGFRLVDRRFWWTYPHVLKRYNMRKATALKRVTSYANPANQVNLPDESYDPYSLKSTGKESPPRPWTALEIVMDVLTSEDALAIPADQIKVDAQVKQLGALNVENLVLDDNGAIALARAMGKIPGLNLHIDYDGKVRLYSELDIAGERKTITSGGPEVEGAGHAAFMSNAAVRARKVRVWFVRKIETRHDAIPVWNPKGSVTPSNRKADDPVMINVVENPWPNLTITKTDPVTKRTRTVTVPQGAWVPLREYIDALNRLSYDGRGKLLKLTPELIGEALMPGVGFGFLFEMAGLTALKDPQRRNWHAAIRSIEEHAFRTYKLNRGFMDRVLHLEDKLVSGLDPESGAMADALVFANYCTLWSQKGKITRAIQDGEASMGQNVFGYPRGSNNPLGFPSITADDQPAGALLVRVLSAAQGIVTLVDKPDATANRAKVLPSIGLNLPVLRRKKSLLSIGHGLQLEGYEDVPPRLDPKEAKRAVIVTTTPAGPNSKYQMHYVDVWPDQCKAKLPAAMHRSLDRKRCLGPVMEFKVPQTVEVARLRYDDRFADKISAMFGANGEAPPAQAEIEPLVLNLDAVAAVDGNAPGASMRDVALGIACAYYAQQRDRYHGARTTFLEGSKRPDGAIDKVTHQAAPDGAPTSYVSLPDDLELLDWKALVDEGTRATLDKDLRP